MGAVITAAKQALTTVGVNVSGVAAINLVLAVCAFGKDLLMAATMGTSSAADALSLAFFIPDTIGNNIMASALGVACVPMFCKLLEAGLLYRLRRVYWQISIFAVVLAALSLLILYLGRNFAVGLLADGLAPDALTLCEKLLTWLLPTLVLFPLATIWGAGLQAQGRYAASAWGPVVYNLFCVAGVGLAFGLHLAPERAAMLTAGGFFAGVVGMALFMGRAFWRNGGRNWLQVQPSPQVNQPQRMRDASAIGSKQAEWQRVARMFVPYLLLLISTQGVYAVERHIASALGSGTVAGLNYAFRLGQFANWVFIAALTTVFLPSVSRALAALHYAEARRQLERALRATLLLTVPISIGMFFLRVPLVTLLFEHGVFDQQSTAITANLLAGYALAIIPQALTAVMIRYFLAVERMRMPVVAGLAAFVVNVTCDWQLAPVWGASALGYGAAIAAWMNAIVLFWCMYGEMKKWGEQGDQQKSLSRHTTGL